VSGDDWGFLVSTSLEGVAGEIGAALERGGVWECPLCGERDHGRFRGLSVEWRTFFRARW
jgi:hypothetical protein